MTRIECTFEQDVIDALQSARWPARAEAALVAHVAGCDVCRDVAAVAALVIADAQDAPAEVRLPDAGAMWLRAQWRARAEAERRVTHPITVAQAGAIAAAAALGGVLLGATSGSLQTWLSKMSSDVGAVMPTSVMPDALVSAILAHVTMTVGVGLAILLTPVVAFLATRE